MNKKQPKEQPVQIIPRNRGHKTETRVFARNIHETYCTHPGCRFRGKRAQQGVCFSREPFVTGTDWKHYELLEKHASNMLDDIRRMYRPKGTSDKKYIQHLEANVWCGWMNESSALDELIYLRKKVGILTDQLAKARKRNARPRSAS